MATSRLNESELAIDLSASDPEASRKLAAAIDAAIATMETEPVVTMYISMETYARFQAIATAPWWKKLYWRVKWAPLNLLDWWRDKH